MAQRAGAVCPPPSAAWLSLQMAASDSESSSLDFLAASALPNADCGDDDSSDRDFLGLESRRQRQQGQAGINRCCLLFPPHCPIRIHRSIVVDFLYDSFIPRRIASVKHTLPLSIIVGFFEHTSRPNEKRKCHVHVIVVLWLVGGSLF